MTDPDVGLKEVQDAFENGHKLEARDVFQVIEELCDEFCAVASHVNTDYTDHNARRHGVQMKMQEVIWDQVESRKRRASKNSSSPMCATIFLLVQFSLPLCLS
eukprot:scpid113440/ scgid17116/ 